VAYRERLELKVYKVKKVYQKQHVFLILINLMDLFKQVL